MPKKELTKSQEIKSGESSELIEERRIRLDEQTQDDMKQYTEFFVKNELKPIKDQLFAFMQEAKTLIPKFEQSLLEFNKLKLMVEQSSSLKLGEKVVLSLYQQDMISLGRAAELCNLKYDKMIDKLVEEGIKLKFGPENTEEALEEEKAFRAKMKEC